MESKINSFKDLEAWKMGHNLVLQVYEVTNSFPKEEQFGITSQIKRAVSSITANISEGFDRYHYNDKKRFYYQARGSLGETENFLILAKDLKFINQETCEKISIEAGRIKQLINGLIRSIEDSQK